MKKAFQLFLFLLGFQTIISSQTPVPFSCSGSDGFGYYSSSNSNNRTSNSIIYSNSRLSKITTSSGNRVTLCNAATIGVALNGLAFNPHDNFLYAVSRYDATKYSGILYRIGENCQKLEIPVSGSIVKFATNNYNTIDGVGGNISSATFDLDNNYYVNTSFTNVGSTGFTNKLQKIEITGNTAKVIQTLSLTCPSCSGTSKLRVTDIIYDEATNQLIGKNEENDKLYKINVNTGLLTLIGSTGISSAILGMYKNRDGNIRAISETGNIYSVNINSGAFTLLSTSTTLNSGNADGASGCYAPPKISGQLYIDANGLSDNIVNGIGSNVIGTTIMYANLILNNIVVKSDVLSVDGLFQFLGLFSGTYEVQISSIKGTIGQVAPSQNTPNTFQWVGDNIGSSAGNDGNPDGKLLVTISMGQDQNQVNFGIDGKPITMGETATAQSNPNGAIRVPVSTLIFSDPEEPNINNITIQTLPDALTQGILYYDDVVVTIGQHIPNYNPALLMVDPVDGDVTVVFSFLTTDMAGVISNVSTINIPFTATILPIELISFEGSHIDEVNVLIWKTNLELNNDFYSVQRKGINDDFQEIGTINSKGNSTELTKYTFTDSKIINQAYYRLVQVDFDGKTEVSNTIFINCMKSYSKIYPTLTNDFLQVESSFLLENELPYFVLNDNGQVVDNGKLTSVKSQIGVANLKNGIYFLILNNGEQNKAYKFIKI